MVDKWRAFDISAALKQAYLAAAMVAAAAKYITCSCHAWIATEHKQLHVEPGTRPRGWCSQSAGCCLLAAACCCCCCCVACCFDAVFACTGRCASTCQSGLLAAFTSLGGAEVEADLVQNHPNFQNVWK